MFITYILHPDIDQTSSADEDHEIVESIKKASKWTWGFYYYYV